MADSDDEYDKKIRDKFRGERTEPIKGVETRRDDRRPREEWIDRDRWSSSRGRGEYRTNTRERYSPGRHETPPVKRMRNSWDDNRRYGFDTPGSNYYGGWTQQPESQAHNTSHRRSPASADPASDTPTAMMTLKAFMNTLDDQVSDEDALKKYAEYKLDFQKQQINQFFVAHKDEEWFKEKYHPGVSGERKKELRNYLEKRLELFKIFLEHDVFEQVVVDVDKQEELVRLMDAFVIRLEGGTDLDLESLDGRATIPVIPLMNDSTKRVKTTKSDKKHATKNNGMNEDVISINDEDEIENKDEENEEGKTETSKENGNKENEEIRSDCDKISDSESGEEQEDTEPKPRALHRTCSIFLKSLPPIISKKDIEEVCKPYNGMLRIALADPQPDRKWSRRGWVTFTRDVDIKDICWSLSSVRIKDVELSPIINKDIIRRVRTVSSMTCNKHVLRNDIKLCTEIIRILDKKNGLWQDDTKTEGNLSSLSSNPVLKNIANYLVEEVSAEEDALLGVDDEENEEDESDPSAFKVLDRMLLYLRLVYSVDYYNHCEYPNEDEMPHRCGIIHARFSSPNKITSSEVSDYCTSFKNKLNHLLDKPKELSEEELIQMGLKNPEVEVEKFIKANTQEIAPSKWLCPLSGKKFKGPEFVLKHIMNKHEDKVEEVKKEVEYFNNYLKDSKRPQFSDQGIPKGRTETHSHMNVTPHAHHSPYSYGFGGGVYPGSGYNRGHSYGYSRPGRGSYGGNRGASRGGGVDYRPIVNYRDLDAPNEPDEFI